MPYIPTEEVESSNIERIGYHRKQQILRIIFHGGRAYDYPMVTEREYNDLMAAESKGKFFNSRIKPMYAHRTPRDVELVVPCCEHPEPNPTCTKECFPCNDWCCPGAPSEASPEAIAAAVKGGLAFGAADHSAAPPTTGSDEATRDCPHGADGRDCDADLCVCACHQTSLDASHLFQIVDDALVDGCHHGTNGRDCEEGCVCVCHQSNAEKVCSHPEQDREERLDGSGAVCGACDADLRQSGDCPHGADGRTCETGCGCIPCHQTLKDACSEHPDGCPDDGHAAPLPTCGAPVDTDKNEKGETNGNPD